MVGTCDCIFLHLGFSRILFRLSNLRSFGRGGCDSVWRRIVYTNVIHTNDELINLFTYVLGELLLYGMFGSVSREEKSGSNLHEQQRLLRNDMLLRDDMLIV
jgi:hypothetical protein